MLSNPNMIYGIHSVTPYDRVTRQPICMLRVLGEASLSLNAEFEELKGGSNMYSWDAEPKEIASEFSFACREYPIPMMEKLLAGIKSEYVPSTLGAIDDFENINGTVISATIGIATIAIVTAADLKEGEYIFVATAPGTVNLYAMTNVDANSGVTLPLSDSMLVDSYALSTNATVNISPLGLSFTCGSAPLLKVNDSARFRIRKSNISGVKLIIGSSASSFSEFGCIIAGQKKSDGSLVYADIYKCRAAGMPISFKEKAYSEWSINIKVLYDSEKDGVFEYIHLK